MRATLLRKAMPLLSVVLFGLALYALQHFLGSYGYTAIFRAARAVPPEQIAQALAWTAASYFVLTWYDALAVRYAGKRLPYRRVALASFVSYSFSHNLGMTVLSSGSARLRFYSGWGLTPIEVTWIVLFCNWTFWLGFLCLGGMTLAFFPLPLPPSVPLPFADTRILGILGMLLGAGVVSFVVRRRTPLTLRRFRLPLPTARLLSVQVVVSALDWLLAASVLHALLPDSFEFSFTRTLSMFVLAQVVAMSSNVPGGLGVFESVLLFLAPEGADASLLMGSLLTYRVVYYLVPLTFAVGSLSVHEWWQRRRPLDPLEEELLPRVQRAVPTGLAVATWILGAAAIFAAVTPSLRWRAGLEELPSAWMALEFAHLAATVIAAVLILLAAGLQERSRSARTAALSLLPVLAVLVALRDGEWELAVGAVLLFVFLAASRRHFYRRSLAFDRFSSGWTAVPLLVAVAAGALFTFSFPRLPITLDLIGDFESHQDAQRAVRNVAIACLVLALGVLRTFRRPSIAPPTRAAGAELHAVERWVHDAEDPSASLALSGEERILFWDERRCAVAFRVERRSWVACGDPIGPRELWADTIARLYAMARAQSGSVAFFAVGRGSLAAYLDQGLTPFELGAMRELDLVRWFAARSDSSMPGGEFEARVRTPHDPLVPLERPPFFKARDHEPESGTETPFFLGSTSRAFLDHCLQVQVLCDGQPLAWASFLSARRRSRLDHLVLAEPSAEVLHVLLDAACNACHQQGQEVLELGLVAPPIDEGDPLQRSTHAIARALHSRTPAPEEFATVLAKMPTGIVREEPRYLVTSAGLGVGRLLDDIAALLTEGFRQS